MNEITRGHDHKTGTQRKQSYQEKNELSTSHEDLLQLVLSDFSDRFWSFHLHTFLATVRARNLQCDPTERYVRHEHAQGVDPRRRSGKERIHQCCNHQKCESQRGEELPVEAEHVVNADAHERSEERRV